MERAGGASAQAEPSPPANPRTKHQESLPGFRPQILGWLGVDGQPQLGIAAFLWEHQITEWSRLERTSKGHEIQPLTQRPRVHHETILELVFSPANH